MMLKNNKEKAITLIALVITIIVLLILAGVTVAMLTGENGLLSKTQLAKERTTEGEQDEKDKLSSYENEIDNYGTWERTGGSGNTVTISQEEYDMLKNAHEYSETRQIVGKYFDGKPIYRYCYRFTKTSTSDLEITFQTMGLTDYPYFDKIVKSETHIVSSPNNFVASEYWFSGSTDFYGHYIKANKQSVVFRSGSDWPKLPSEFLFIIEYTKTEETTPQQ